MKSWIRAAVLAALVSAAVGACARGGDIAAPDGSAARRDGTPADSSTTTQGWGGFIGGGS